MSESANEIKWFGYPIRFYIDNIELPWIIMAGTLLLLYVIGFSQGWSYLYVFGPISLVAEMVTVALGVNFIGFKKCIQLKPVLVYGLLLGFFSGLISSLLAFFRFWQLWLFFNIVVESLTAAVGGVAVAWLVYYLNHLPRWQFKR